MTARIHCECVFNHLQSLPHRQRRSTDWKLLLAQMMTPSYLHMDFQAYAIIGSVCCHFHHSLNTTTFAVQVRPPRSTRGLLSAISAFNSQARSFHILSASSFLSAPVILQSAVSLSSTCHIRHLYLLGAKRRSTPQAADSH